MESDEIWDEERWEAFLREHDRQFDRFMHDVHEFMRLQPPPAEPARYRRWKERLKAFLLGKGWRHVHFILSELDPDLAEQEGESADALHDEDVADEPAPEKPAIYEAAYRLGLRVMQWANGLPGYQKDSALVQYCSNVMEIGAGVSRGHALGYEQDALGGNIAWAKRALNAANAALEGLHEMRVAPYMSAQAYGELYEQTYEVRNGLAIHVQELRARFELGVD